MGGQGLNPQSLGGSSNTGASESDSFSAEFVGIKKEPVADVTEWGATPDDGSEDTQAFRDALDYLKNNGGGTLFVPKGTFLVGVDAGVEGPTLDWGNTSGIGVQGVGAASEIKVPDGAASGSDYGVSLLIPGPEWFVTNIKLNGNQSNQGTITDEIDGGNIVNAGPRGVAHNFWSINSTGDGVEMVGERCRVTSAYFENNNEQDVHIWNSHTVVNGFVAVGCRSDGSIAFFSDGQKAPNDIKQCQVGNGVILNPNTEALALKQASGQSVIEPHFSNLLIIDAGNPDSGSGDAAQDNAIQMQRVIRPRLSDIGIINPVGHGAEFTTGCESPRLNNVNVRGAGKRGFNFYNVDDIRAKFITAEQCQEDGIAVQNQTGSTHDRYKFENLTVIDCNQADGDNQAFYAAGDSIDALIINNPDIESTGSVQMRRGLQVLTNSGATINVELSDARIRGMEFTEVNTDADAKFARLKDNDPRVSVDVRNIVSPSEGQQAYHDPSVSGDSNTEGEAQYIGSSWTSLVDGTTIS